MQIGPILRAMARSKTKVALLILEIAFTTAIVLNSLAMIADQRAQMQRDSGLDEEHLVAVSLQPWGEAFADDAFSDAQAERDRNLPSSRPVRFRQQTARKRSAITTRPTVAGGTTARTRIHSMSGVTRLLSGRGKRPPTFCSWT